jgi:hypothetical protein
MMATLRYTIQVTHDGAVGRSTITPRQITATVGDNPSTAQLTVTEADPVAIPLGEITTPRFLYAVNLDADNFIQILDDATEIGRLLPGNSCMMALPAGVDLKAQAVADDCEMLFAVYGAA